MKSNKLYDSLPAQVQKEVRNSLKGFREVHIWFENGEYHVSVGACVKREYGDDYEPIGVLANSDIYTTEEQILNTAELFRSYPVSYHGKRDQELLAALTEDTPLDYDSKGNIIPKPTDAGARLAPDYFLRKARDLDRMKDQLLGWMDAYDVHGDPDAVQALSDALAGLKEVIDNTPLY